MILGIILILVALAVAYFHYAQGLFSAVISATLAVLAAVYAVGYHETVYAALLGGKYPDYAPAAILVVIFAVLYTLGRIAFDRLVPGNVMLPNTADRAAAALVGVVAGLAVAGVLGVAAQQLPFGPSVGGASRYEVATRTDVNVPRTGGRQTVTLEVPDELRVDELDPARRQTLLLPADDLLVGLVSRLSDGGSLAGAQPLAAANPAYLDAMFARRLGVQVGARRSAVNTGPVEQVTVPDAGVAVYGRLPQVPGEIEAIRPDADLPASVEPGPGRVLLAVRTRVDRGAADSDNLFRVSPAAVRLVAAGEEARPIGTLERGALLVRNKLDDPLFARIDGDAGTVDWVFEAPAAAVTGLDTDAAKVAEGTFVEVKRFARADLSGEPVAARLPPEPSALRRKPGVEERIAAAGAAAPADEPTETPADAPADPATPPAGG